MAVVVDSFTTMTPTSYHASPVDSFTFDILHCIYELIDGDVYVATDGDNQNDGLTPASPFQTIHYALSRIAVDNTIHLAAGVYSHSANGELFPLLWSNHVNLSGYSMEETILDAELSARVFEFDFVSDATITDLTITNGMAENGGGIYCDNSTIELHNVTVSDNTAEEDGGGIYSIESSPILVNCSILRNSALNHGGGIHCATSYPVLQQVTIAGNSANDGGGIYCIWEACASLENCIMWGDLPQEVSFYGLFGWNAITVTCSNIEGGEAGIETNGNGVVYWAENSIDADPLFCDPDNGNYRLQLNSPCRTDICGFMGYTGETCEGEHIDALVNEPTGFYLADAYPNPFNPSTTIDYNLATSGSVQLAIYNIRGQLVEVIQDGYMEAGRHSVTWAPVDLSSGVYICRLTTGTDAVSRKLIMVR